MMLPSDKIQFFLHLDTIMTQEPLFNSSTALRWRTGSITIADFRDKSMMTNLHRGS